MQEFKGKVAVVTGAASGMGRAFAERFAREGMRVVLADVERPRLEATVRELQQQKHDVLGVPTDVSKQESVDALAQRTLEAYGAVHVLCNNAGVLADADMRGFGAMPTPVWEQSLEEWHWTFGVNLWGVVHGIRSFVPIMVRQNEPAHVVNTASIAGLASSRTTVIYGTSKFGVVRISEGLHLQLATLNSPVKVSVLCPGLVNTHIFSSSRNRPDDLWADEERPTPEEHEARERQIVEAPNQGRMEPEQVAEKLLQAIKDEQFYILPHGDTNGRIKRRMETLLAQRNPTND